MSIDFIKYRETCPDCKVKLEWEQIHGMRLLNEHDGKEYYDTRCPKCESYFNVLKK